MRTKGFASELTVAIMIFNIHGIGKPTRMSKMFEPIDEETAMSPSPFIATATEDTASGIDVPAARIVKPMMTEAEQDPRNTMSPRISTHQTRKKEKPAIHKRDVMNVKMYHLAVGGGVSRYKAAYTGIEIAHTMMSLVPSGRLMKSRGSSSSSSSALSSAASAAPGTVASSIAPSGVISGVTSGSPFISTGSTFAGGTISSLESAGRTCFKDLRMFVSTVCSTRSL
mmetsp:Transcript_74958/g.217581  ORF Transcript_74958/g.217581 Transcript_74958/m.217581 type:complete len:226 (+) Transcript_74958:584-1261(+)